MKGVNVIILMVLAVLLVASLAFAMQNEASMEKGKALFNDPKLGTSGKACSSCHADGKVP